MQLHLEMHQDDDWRLTPTATNSWLGVVCNEGADEVIDFTSAVDYYGWEVAHDLAKACIAACTGNANHDHDPET